MFRPKKAAVYCGTGAEPNVYVFTAGGVPYSQVTGTLYATSRGLWRYKPSFYDAWVPVSRADMALRFLRG